MSEPLEELRLLEQNLSQSEEEGLAGRRADGEDGRKVQAVGDEERARSGASSVREGETGLENADGLLVQGVVGLGVEHPTALDEDMFLRGSGRDRMIGNEIRNKTIRLGSV